MLVGCLITMVESAPTDTSLLPSGEYFTHFMLTATSLKTATRPEPGDMVFINDILERGVPGKRGVPKLLVRSIA